MPDVARLAVAFGLPVAEVRLEPFQHGDLPTWRMITGRDSYLIKRLLPADQPLPRASVRRSIELEQAAAEAGIRTAEPLVPVRPELGWCTLIEDEGWFRAHAWVEHRPLAADEDISAWLGRTLAILHRLQPTAETPDWSALGLIPTATWASWIDQAERAGCAWAALADRRLPYVTELTERLRSLCDRVPDPVVTHGDINPNNVLITTDGPVLIDWDTVWPYSAALQAGQVARTFGQEQPDRMRAILDAYREAGGRTDWAGEELLLGAAAQKLAALGIRIPALLGHRPPPRWIDPATAERRIVETLEHLPALVDDLIDRGRTL